jgi:ribose transport system substrate-binding protein
MTRIRIVTALLVGGLALGVASAVYGSIGKTAAPKPVRIAYFAAVQNGFVQAVLAGAGAGAHKAGGRITSVFAANGSVTAQISQIEDATTSGKYDAFIIFMLDPAVGTAVFDAVKHGIKVATAESAATQNILNNIALRGTVISTTEALSHRVEGLAQLVISACRNVDPCKVGWLYGLQQNPSDVAIFDGMKSRLDSYRNIQIVATGQGFFATAPAQAAAQNILQAHPDINVFAADSDDMTYGIELAAQSAGKTGIKLIGVGASVRGCAAVKSGRWFGTTNSLPRTAGMQAALAVIEAVRTGKYRGQRAWDAFAEAHLPLVTTQANASKCPGQWSS